MLQFAIRLKEGNVNNSLLQFVIRLKEGILTNARYNLLYV